MSTKNSILYTDDHNEHWFSDCSEPLYESNKNAITMEFSKSNIRIESNDDNFLIITIINPDCELYDIISKINQ